MSTTTRKYISPAERKELGMKNNSNFVQGNYSPNKHEDQKYLNVNNDFLKYIDTISPWNLDPKEVIAQFPAFVGYVNLARTLSLYELYKKVQELSGDIAEVGTFKGASFLLWAKLITLFEPYNATQVYGFDWFKGMDSGETKGQFVGSYETLIELIHLQQLENIALLYKMNVIEEAKAFIGERPHLRFKILFIDCSIKEVMECALDAFYPRLVTGGVLIMDHYNLKISPHESDITDKYIGKNKIMQLPFNRQPTGYVIKEE